MYWTSAQAMRISHLLRGLLVLVALRSQPDDALAQVGAGHGHIGEVEGLDLGAARAGGDFADVGLIAKAVLDQAPLPDQLLTDSGPPGTYATLVSPRLLNAEDRAEIVIGADLQTQTVIRPTLGYATFVIPFAGAAAAPGIQTVTLRLNGKNEASYHFTVTQPEALPTDAVIELNLFLDELQQLLADNEALVSEQLDGVPLSADAREVLLAGAVAGRMQAKSTIAELKALLVQPNGTALAETFFLAANANGLTEYRAQLQTLLAASTQTSAPLAVSLAAIGPSEACDELVPAICALKQATGCWKALPASSAPTAT